LPEKSQEDNNGTVQNLPIDPSKHPSGPGCPEDVVKQSEPEGENNVVVLSKDSKYLLEKEEDEQESLSDPNYSSALTRCQNTTTSPSQTS